MFTIFQFLTHCECKKKNTYVDGFKIILNTLLNKYVGFWIDSQTFKLSDFQVRGDQIGPALVHLHMQSSIMGAGVMVQYVLPLEPMLQKVVHMFFTAPGWSPVYAKLVLWGESGDYYYFFFSKFVNILSSLVTYLVLVNSYYF